MPRSCPHRRNQALCAVAGGGLVAVLVNRVPNAHQSDFGEGDPLLTLAKTRPSNGTIQSGPSHKRCMTLYPWCAKSRSVATAPFISQWSKAMIGLDKKSPEHVKWTGLRCQHNLCQRNLESLAEGFSGLLDKLKFRRMFEIKQAVNLRHMDIQPPCQFRFLYILSVHFVPQQNLRFF